jgi:hypothetical protein
MDGTSYDDFGAGEMYHFSTILPDEVWGAVSRDESLLGDSLNQYARLDEAARRAVADEIVFYYAGTRIARDLVNSLAKSCELCGACPECLERENVVNGTKMIEIGDVVDIAKTNDWSRYATEAIADVPFLSGSRTQRMVVGAWDETRLIRVESCLRPYLLAPTFIDEAAGELIARTNDVVAGYARRRRRRSARRNGWRR